MKINKKTMKRNEKGITLIALVITIIVLLILAGVSISMLTGESGLLTQADNSKKQQAHGTVVEWITLLYNQYQIEINTANNTKLASTETVTIQGEEEKALANTSLTFTQFLQGENSSSKNYFKEGNILDVEAVTGSKQALGNGTDTDVYKIEIENSMYALKYYGEEGIEELLWQVALRTGEIDWDSVLADATANPEKYKHPDQSDTNGDIGIGADGNPVNMDKWKYTNYSNKIGLTGRKLGGYAHGGLTAEASYSYEYDVEENIITDIVVPQYIKVDGADEFYEVTYVGDYTFYRCSNLTSIILPDTITGIYEGAFYNCSGLTSVVVSNNVTSIGYYAFYGCSSLTEVNYNGTMEQWNAIAIDANGNDSLSNATIHCTDGDIVPSTE